MYRAKLQAQLKSLSTVNPTTQCWEWQGQIANSGRGRTMIQGESGTTRTVSAEDASYIAFFGEIPANMLVQQTCGNRLCINPEHLTLMPLP
ncbi:MAG TPA: HNH endonuclease [Candidatus Thiothrix moscowensis]|uniref:HNH endonuclease n=1 Tax=unclassified Thiothrix TaxID=2636184 RepID=UPI0025EDBD91|nr:MULTISPECIES: HNH endonuclease [unclassified Thiothrix]HRJ54415.1 HNH endonuclease [Candidatus Thiothrix moscowensis]HRJ94721.1 HNH endonuclease [Candidatus Thiothrix moscowensis]